jgi:hypothetical protein
MHKRVAAVQRLLELGILSDIRLHELEIGPFVFVRWRHPVDADDAVSLRQRQSYNSVSDSPTSPSDCNMHETVL